MRALGYILFAALMVCSLSAFSQQLDDRIDVIGGTARVQHPSSMAVSPGGEKIAIADLNTNRIVIFDLYGRLLWEAGDQVRLDQPRAVCFETETRVLFTTSGSLVVTAVIEDDIRRVDTAKDLSEILPSWRGIDQILRGGNGGYLLLNGAVAEVAVFDSDWEFRELLITHGSGKGSILAPSSMATTLSGKLVVADRKNFPLQIFDGEGKFLVYGGWNQPSQERGWEAAAVAVDTRDMIWVADETNARYRLFDQAGTIVATVPFDNPAVSPVAMAATIDNRMAVLEETGSLLFYTLQ